MKKLVSKNKIIFVVLLGLVLRLISLDQSFWLDETTSAQVVKSLSFSEIVTNFSPSDFHPPFYYLALKVWGSLFGAGEIALRSFSVFFGLATVYFVFLIAKEARWKFPELPALLLATSGLHVYYSQEARMYVLSAFLVTSLFYLFLKLLKFPKSKYWFIFSLLLVVNGLTDYLPNLILPVFWILAFLQKKNKAWWKMFLLSHLPLVLVFAFWMPTFLAQLSGGLAVKTGQAGWWSVLGKTTFKELLLVPTKFMFGRISFVNKTLYALVTGIAGAVFALLMLLGIKKKSSRAIWMWLLVPIAISAILGFKISVFSYFRLIFVLPAFYLLLSYGITKLKGRKYKFALLFVLGVNLISSGAYLTNQKFQREDWRGLVNHIERESGENSITLFVSSGQMEAYNYYSTSGRIAGPKGLSSEYDQIWLMRYVKDIFDPKDELRVQVEDLGYEKVEELDFNGVVVWEYEK